MYQTFLTFIIMELTPGVISMSKKVVNGSESMQSYRSKIINKCGIIGVELRKNIQLQHLCQFIYAKNIGKLLNF